MFYDVVIIGGGINGVGVAQAVTSAGYSCLLIEKTALAAATSSCSSKLIHGGLRYLEGFDFSLVRESLQERELLLKLAPDLVSLQPFYMPVYPDTSRQSFTLRLGLSMYALLGGLRRSSRFSQVSKADWAALDGLKTDQLKAVFRYFDAQTDDAALTRAVMQSAKTLGAALACPAEVLTADVSASGVELIYREAGKEKTVDCRCVVNASGPWVNQVNALISPRPPSISIDLVQGTHLVLDRPIVDRCYYIEAPTDKRALFVLPWKEKTLLGTTETLYSGDPALVAPLEEEQQYLLSVLAFYFPDQRANVVGKMAGLRVLPKENSEMFARSRDTVLLPDNTQKPRVVSIYGGKLTVYRKTAEKVLQLLKQSLPVRKPIADTRKILLSPAE